MGLVVSTIGSDSGLLWEQNLNTSLATLDAHNHTPGNGVSIPSNGLNINASLPFNNNSATGLQVVAFTQQASASTLNALFVGTDGNLYFNDGGGDPSIKITAGGAVNATSSGISSGSNTASFVSNVLVVNAATNTPANIQAASILLGNNSAGTNFVTLSPPSALASNYPLVLPLLPTGTSFLQIDTSGNITGAVATSQGITASNIANGTLTTTQISSTAGITGTQIAATTIAASNIVIGTLTTTQISSSAGIVYTQLAAPNTWSGTLASQTTYTSTATPVSISSFVPSTARPLFYSFTGTGAGGGGIQIPNTVALTITVTAGLNTISSQFIDNRTGSGTLNLPMSVFNFSSAGVNVGATHTTTFVITYTAGTGSVIVDAFILNVMQL